MHSHPRLSGLLLLPFLLAGCGKAELEGPACHPARGKVLFGGKPAAKVEVYFHPTGGADPKAPRPHATTDAKGEYHLTTRRLDDGAPEGEYLVTFFWPTAENVEEPADRLGRRYNRPENSKVRVAIRPGVNDIPPFDLR